ncbi:hypothetical protein AGMMS4957_06850 [Bacteroidia bacterium]|nr:hypothetical protein AGMMS4957_06850 [Bacteroidia bacterium]
MTAQDRQNIELEKKILKGLDIAYEKLLADKKANNGELIVLRGDEIVRIKP